MVREGEEEGDEMRDLHNIPGWYWVEEGYEAEGSCGPFMTKKAALRHAVLNEAEDPYVVYLSDIELVVI